jgi:hypothetical protein
MYNVFFFFFLFLGPAMGRIMSEAMQILTKYLLQCLPRHYKRRQPASKGCLDPNLSQETLENHVQLLAK